MAYTFSTKKGFVFIPMQGNVRSISRGFFPSQFLHLLVHLWQAKIWFCLVNWTFSIKWEIQLMDYPMALCNIIQLFIDGEVIDWLPPIGHVFRFANLYIYTYKRSWHFPFILVGFWLVKSCAFICLCCTFAYTSPLSCGLLFCNALLAYTSLLLVSKFCMFV